MTNDRPLTISQAAEYLDLSTAYLYTLTSTGKIPHYKPNGKRIYFFKSELDDFIKAGRVKTNQELEAEAEEFLAS